MVEIVQLVRCVCVCVFVPIVTFEVTCHINMYFVPGRGEKYCDKYVCLSVHLYNSKIT